MIKFIKPENSSKYGGMEEEGGVLERMYFSFLE